MRDKNSQGVAAVGAVTCLIALLLLTWFMGNMNRVDRVSQFNLLLTAAATTATPSPTVSVPSTPTPVSHTATPTQEPISPLLYARSVTLHFGSYNPMWEYLEHGQSSELYHPQPATVSWESADGEWLVTFLAPPTYRALVAAVEAEGDDTLLQVEYVMSGTLPLIQGVRRVGQGDDGQFIWQLGDSLPPRELNALEKRALESGDYFGGLYRLGIKDPAKLLDRLPSVEAGDWPHLWSPLEDQARALAFFAHATEASTSNPLLVLNVYGADMPFRAIDPETGQLLKRPGAPWGDEWSALRLLPVSRKVALQTSDDLINIRWYTFATFEHLEPGFYLCVDINVCRAGKLNQVVYWGHDLIPWMADQTREVPEAELLAALEKLTP